MASSQPSSTLPFDRERFKNDVSRVCSRFHAVYDNETMDRILNAYGENFHRGAVLWKATNREQDGVAFRFYERRKVDVIAPALKHGLLNAQNSMIPLILSWANLTENAIASCDFDPAEGLHKTWVWLGDILPLEKLLHAPAVPTQLRPLEHKFKSVDLHYVRHAAVDWHSSTVNIYFWVPEAITHSRVNDLVSLSGAEPISAGTFQGMKSFFRPHAFTFATTIDVKSGTFKRVAFYALRLANNDLPSVGDRLMAFFKEAVSYDSHDLNIVAWSFAGGPGESSNYVKGERSYCGNLEDVLDGWGSPIGNTFPCASRPRMSKL